MCWVASPPPDTQSGSVRKGRCNSRPHLAAAPSAFSDHFRTRVLTHCSHPGRAPCGSVSTPPPGPALLPRQPVRRLTNPEHQLPSLVPAASWARVARGPPCRAVVRSRMQLGLLWSHHKGRPQGRLRPSRGRGGGCVTPGRAGHAAVARGGAVGWAGHGTLERSLPCGPRGVSVWTREPGAVGSAWIPPALPSSLRPARWCACRCGRLALSQAAGPWAPSLRERGEGAAPQGPGLPPVPASPAASTRFLTAAVCPLVVPCEAHTAALGGAGRPPPTPRCPPPAPAWGSRHSGVHCGHIDVALPVRSAHWKRTRFWVPRSVQQHGQRPRETRCCRPRASPGGVGSVALAPGSPRFLG